MLTPLKKILIANRGEIALRINRAARESGMTTVGIYAESDEHSPWIKKCAESFSLGEGSLKDTYLNIPKIIAFAKQSGADSIHPGYGFLSENYLFAEACKQNSITFIGPSAAILKLAGDKTASNSHIESLGIAIPGMYTGTPGELSSMDGKLKYPLLVKAAAGGGGKGMRLVSLPRDLADILKTASREAFHYFGDDRVFIEKYIPRARHIEVQIMGDHHGNVAHLYERECSIQRRHQKIIEETPSIVLSDLVRNEITEAALKIARSLQYTNAGTIEFLLDDQGKFYFMEINPRLQVEHGITEMITGIDIVKEQISIASGNPLSFGEVNITGHAIEARIYAEDPENDLLPSPGRVYFFSPTEMPDVRIESVTENDTIISGEFDPLLGKVLVHATTRDAAVAKMQKAIEHFKITGVRNNLSLLKVILHHDQFLENDITTGYIQDNWQILTGTIVALRKKTDTALLAIASAVIVLDRKSGNSPWNSGFWRNIRQIRFRNGTEIIEMDYYRTGDDSFEFCLNEELYNVTAIKADKYSLSFTLNGEKRCLYPLPEKAGIIEISDGHLDYRIERFSIRENVDISVEPESATGHGNLILAPQPGTILDIKVAEGQLVNRGDGLLTIESMKLENTILAGRTGMVKKITIKAGDKVKKNEPLMYLQETINN